MQQAPNQSPQPQNQHHRSFPTALTQGERTCLVVTKGFPDLLHIGNQSRPGTAFDELGVARSRGARLPAGISCPVIELITSNAEIFDLEIRMPDNLYERVVEVDEEVRGGLGQACQA